jgi:hypothetical protein
LIIQAHIAALARQAIRNPPVLAVSNFHPPSFTKTSVKVN